MRYLIAILLMIGPAAAQPVQNPIYSCLLIEDGIQRKEASLRAWEITLLVHVSRSADNILALPGMQADSITRFENGLRRARQIDLQVRAIIDRVYDNKAPP